MIVSLEEIEKKLRAKNKYWVVFTGDSITSADWVHPNWREIFEYVIKKEITKRLGGDWQTSQWGTRFFNFAYDGATTSDILEKLKDMMLVKPDLVISVMGGNDSLFNVPVKKHVENITKIMNKFTESGVKIVWCTSTPSLTGSQKNVEYAPYAKACMKIAKRKNVQLVDMFNKYKIFPLENIFTLISEGDSFVGIKEGEVDPNHPNQLGNANIAKVIFKEVFSLEFDPEKYIKETLKGIQYPGY